MDAKEIGNLGEKLACEYLVKKGFKILGKNDRISFGEIDIIARKKFPLFARFDTTIHFVEVKTIIGNNDSFFPEERVDFRKQHKLRQLTQIWLENHKYKQEHPYQIDVIGILVDLSSRNAKLHYFPNAVAEN